MGMVMLALASFTTSVAAGWRNSRNASNASLVGRRVGEQVQASISSMLSVIYSKPGDRSTASNAYLFYWANDGYGGAADGKAQFGEMGLLEFDASAKTLKLYEPKSSSALSITQRTIASSSNWGTATSQSQMDSIVSYYKSMGLGSSRLIAGPDSNGTGSTVDATSLSLFVPTNGKPMVMYSMLVTSKDGAASGGASTTARYYGTATLRMMQNPSNVN